ncbi:traB domain-containing protein [Brassica rapa]|uniref:traB domain-containing protein n=1 Tax=Brassica campestris TaxID=3711 RepID=UPI0004F16741|nr:traB domain-containing protein [Brassica rapa]XP_033147676.1 traB domain-containing protein [Brassica rapa]
MEPTVAPPEPEAQSGDISVRDNIVNVEKTEEEEQEHSDSGSAITGVDLIFVAGDDDISIGADGVVERTKMELPKEYANSVMVLTCGSKAEGGSCDVYLIGTAHVSEESCREVEAIVSYMKPEVVFVELCASRLSILTPQAVKIPTVWEMIDMWKKKHNPFGIAYGWFLAKIASKLDVLPGAEFRVAYEEAVKYGGQVILGDRPVQITLKRTWAKMPIWHKVKFLYGLVFQAVFLPSPEELEKMLKAMNDVDMLTLVIQQMSKEFPSLMDTLVHERDKYISCMLSRVACEHSSVVAVVGRGHLQGIKKNWDQPINMKDLLEIPKNKSVFTVKNVLKSLAVLVIGAAIVSRIYLAGRS